MTNDEICDKFLASMGYTRVSGHTLEPVLPALMLDLNYQIFQQEVKPLNCKQNMKVFKNRWIDAYNRFNTRFFKAFTQDEADEVIDRMDEFENWIANDVMITKVQIMNLLDDLPFETAKTCASLMIANILAQSAGIVWSHCYKTKSGYDCKNMDIYAIERASASFMNLYHKAISQRNVKPSESKPICDAVDVLCNKMIKFLYKDDAPDAEPEIQVKTQK